jgi:hypothetical protein
MKLFTGVLFFFFICVLNLRCQNSNTVNPDFFTIGYEHHFYPGWEAKSGMLEYGFTKTNPRILHYYRFSAGATVDRKFYMHVPGGLALLSLAVVGAFTGNGCNAGSGNLAKMLAIPGGFGFRIIDAEQFSSTIYSDFISVDIAAASKKWEFDYAPEAGIQTHIFFKDHGFVSLRGAASYSFLLKSINYNASLALGISFRD